MYVKFKEVDSLDIRQLETFVEVSKQKSFSKAADKLFLTQPTVTNHIQNLEKELGTLLINRMGKTISLTDAGMLLYKNSLNIINSFEMTKFELAKFVGQIHGHLDIFASSVPRQYLLPSLIHFFIDEYPDVTFSISDKDSKEVVVSIVDGESDFGFVGTKYELNNLEYINVMEDNLVLIAPNSFNSNGDNFTELKIEDIIKNKFIFREEGSGTRNELTYKLEEKGFGLDQLKIIAYVKDNEAIKELVALGAGLSFLSKQSVITDLEAGRYKAFNIKDLDLKRQFYFVFHKNRQLSPLGETFKNFVTKHTNSL